MWPSGGALNAPLTFGFDADLAPLSVTAGAVRVTSADGRALAHRVVVDASTLSVVLTVPDAMLADPPAAVRIRLGGLPSASALGFRDGRRLGSPAEVLCELQPRLAPAGAAPARLIAVDGNALPVPATLDAGEVVVLTFDGVLDPDTLTPTLSPLSPLVGDVLVAPRAPGLAWTVSGARTTVELRLPATHVALEFAMRRMGWRDLRGESPDPALVVTLRRP